MGNQRKDIQPELLARIQTGDTEALNELLEEIQPQLYRFSLNMCRHVEDAEDVLQEEMVAVSRSVENFEGKSSFSTYLFTIARRFCIRKRRLRKGEPAVPSLLEEVDEAGAIARGATPEEEAERRELLAALQQAIGDLEPDYREVLLLRDMEGLKASEVAEVLEISVGAVKSRLHRARIATREAIRPAQKPRPGCPDILLTLSRYLEGELNSTICAEMEQHVEGCPRCASECTALREALALCERSICRVPPSVQKRISEAIQGQE